jgi:hypothetical protein
MKVAASVSLVICAAALASAPAKGQEAEAVSQAKAAATSWLALVDAGNYAASWQQTAGLFQSAISEQSWVSAVQATRASLGALQSRQVASATYTRTLPGAPTRRICLHQVHEQVRRQGQRGRDCDPHEREE